MRSGLLVALAQLLGVKLNNLTWLEKIDYVERNHPYSDIYDIPPNYEICLPIPEAGRHPLSMLEGGCDVLVGLHSKDVSELILNGVRESGDKKLTEDIQQLLKIYSPTGLTIFKKGAWVVCTSNETDGRPSEFLLVRPFRKSSFGAYFGIVGGMAEFFLPDGGRFYYLDSADTYSNSLDFMFDEGNQDHVKWRDALVVFCASNGEQILFNRTSSEIGWHLMGKGIVKCPFDLNEVAMSFLSHIIKDGWAPKGLNKQVREPYDSFSTNLKNKLTI